MLEVVVEVLTLGLRKDEHEDHSKILRSGARDKARLNTIHFVN